MTAPGPSALGRGVIIAADTTPPEAWAGAPVVRVDEGVLTDPSGVVTTLHAHWAARRPVVVALAVDPGRFRAPTGVRRNVWEVAVDFEPWFDRLHFLVWANNYDARTGECIWWWSRKAARVGATEGGDADVVLPSSDAAWIDGGPPDDVDPALVSPAALVRSESVESGSLVPVPSWIPPAAELAPDQLEAVAHRGGPARIIAPAGSGKTRVLTERLRHLLADRHHERGGLVAVAYNRKAQEEMASRTEGVGARIQTLNALGFDLIGRYHGRRPSVLEEREVRRRLERHLPRLTRRLNTDPMAPYLEAMSVVRLGLRAPDEVEVELDVTGLADAIEPYRAGLRTDMVVDFDEQIAYAIELLLEDGDFRRQEQARHRHLLVDEFQDLTPAHVLLVRLLAAPGYDVFGVGDDDQVIYGHAGASPRFLVEFASLFPGAAEHALEVNYRCPPAVVDAARTLLSYNDRRVPKEIRAARDDGGAHACEVTTHEPTATGMALVDAVQRGAALGGPGAVAVLTRTNSLLLAPHVMLSQAGVPITSVLRPDVLNRVGLRAALGWLRIANDPGSIDPADLAEVSRRPSRGFPRWVDKWLGRCRSGHDVAKAADRIDDDRVADKFRAFAADIDAIADAGTTTRELLVSIRDEIGLGGAMELLDGRPGAEGSSHLDDLDALLQLADLEPDPVAFEPWLRATLASPSADVGVTLSTVHRVKGREWPHVVVFGADAGIMPHRLADDIEEERRVFHVAITRGIETVQILADKERPSMFLDELDGTAPKHRPAPARRHAVNPLTTRTAAKTDDTLDPVATARFEALRAWRSAKARSRGGPAFTIFGDATLKEIARQRPTDLRGLRAIKGVGPSKLEDFGDEVLSILDDHDAVTNA